MVGLFWCSLGVLGGFFCLFVWYFWLLLCDLITKVLFGHVKEERLAEIELFCCRINIAGECGGK